MIVDLGLYILSLLLSMQIIYLYATKAYVNVISQYYSNY